eukprot:EG_transcript_1088
MAAKAPLCVQCGGGLTVIQPSRGQAVAICPLCGLIQPKGNEAADDELHTMARETVSETINEEVFCSYVCQSLTFGQPHPGNVVEATTLAACPLPAATYPLPAALPAGLIEAGTLSALQLEGALYACQRHQQILPSGQRAGFFLGDQTGVGKGRQVAGIVFDNAARGRLRHLWFSTSADLRLDAERDLRDIGCHLPVINGCKQLDQERKGLGLTSAVREGVLFCTYSTLTSILNRGGGLGAHSRLDQLVAWCGGPDYDGCIVFDECHKAKNYVPGSENASTKVSKAVMRLQNLLPKARVVYCSATGVAEIHNMAYMERLGLWGAGTPFRDFESFEQSFSKRGVGALEMLAVEMKLAGMYVSRGLSYKDAEFHTVDCPLSPAQLDLYDRATALWEDLRVAFGVAVDKLGGGGARPWLTFWATHQRFFKQLLIALKVPATVATVRQALADGHSVVIGLQTTGEASMSKEVASMSTNMEGQRWCKDLVSVTEEMLVQFLETHFPVEPEDMFTTEVGVEGIVQLQRQMHAVMNCRAKRVELIERTVKLGLPPTALDDLIDQLSGPDAVAEMTGRKSRLLRSGVGFVHEARCKPGDDLDQVNVKEREHFMAGSKLIAIISDAASTGISLHADKGAKNQKRRVHITIELAWSAEKTIQQLGRSHRSNQRSAPLFKLMATAVGGEQRFAAAVARKLESMGALRGDRRAAMGGTDGSHLDTRYGREALGLLTKAIQAGRPPLGVSLEHVLPAAYVSATGSSGDIAMHAFHDDLQLLLQRMGLVDDPGMDVKKFLNRLLGLPVQSQGILFQYFLEVLRVVVVAAKQSGRFDGGVADIHGESIVLDGPPVVVYTDPISGACTRSIGLMVDRGISWDAALAKLRATGGTHPASGFYKSRSRPLGRLMHLLAFAKAGTTDRFIVCRPNTGMSPIEEDAAFLRRYEKVAPEEAREGWQQQYDLTQDGCIHGPDCRARSTCTVGARRHRLDVLCGSVGPIWGALQRVLDGHAVELPRSDRSLRVVRVVCDDGGTVVGARFPSVLLPEVIASLHDLAGQEALRATGTIVVEPPSPVLPKCLARVQQPQRTLASFFGPKKRSPTTRTPEEEEDTRLCSASLDDADKVVADLCDTPSPSLPPDPTTAPPPTLAAWSPPRLGPPPAAKRRRHSDAVRCPVCHAALPPSTTNWDLNRHVDACVARLA